MYVLIRDKRARGRNLQVLDEKEAEEGKHLRCWSASSALALPHELGMSTSHQRPWQQPLRRVPCDPSLEEKPWLHPDTWFVGAAEPAALLVGALGDVEEAEEARQSSTMHRRCARRAPPPPAAPPGPGPARRRCEQWASLLPQSTVHSSRRQQTALLSGVRPW